MTPPLLTLQGLRFAWPGSASDCLDIADFQLVAGETVFLHGPSGSGKSTLLSLLAGVLLPQAGDVALQGISWGSLRPSRRDRYRVDHLGYIFQQFNLLPYLTALDNVLLPCRFSTQRREAALRHAGSPRAAAEHWLKGMELDSSSWQRPAHTLSVGQQQRVAAARALIGQPDLIIADEPTSALDEDRREVFLDLLMSACASGGTALVFVSHDQRISRRFDRQVSLPSLNRAAYPQNGTTA